MDIKKQLVIASLLSTIAVSTTPVSAGCFSWKQQRIENIETGKQKSDTEKSNKQGAANTAFKQQLQDMRTKRQESQMTDSKLQGRARNWYSGN
ncbi:MAG: hypothetical protein EU981_02885 [Candidatus Liberibacter ctenarytainae]|uniref:Lipoprotein n=1 Tax=Candidatus Liberibacter ctenarytainae TaxID=2020335 RepID=A0A937ALL5_9HYPH|nr:hypothetical protein [Candidatus Liberibacter ctenarytainae]